MGDARLVGSTFITAQLLAYLLSDLVALRFILNKCWVPYFLAHTAFQMHCTQFSLLTGINLMFATYFTASIDEDIYI
jgi:hypothetical protein